MLMCVEMMMGAGKREGEIVEKKMVMVSDAHIRILGAKIFRFFPQVKVFHFPVFFFL